jgi:hypothetical protein
VPIPLRHSPFSPREIGAPALDNLSAFFNLPPLTFVGNQYRAASRAELGHEGRVFPPTHARPLLANRTGIAVFALTEKDGERGIRMNVLDVASAVIVDEIKAMFPHEFDKYPMSIAKSLFLFLS